MEKPYLKLLNHIKAKRKITITVDELRALLLSDIKSYPQYGNFKQSVLLTAVRNINDRTDRTVEMEEIKRGKEVREITFVVKKKENKVVPQTRTDVKGNMMALSYILESGELYNCLDKISIQIENIKGIVEDIDNGGFLEEGYDMAESFLDNVYERETVYRLDMENYKAELEQAVESKNNLINDNEYDDIEIEINNMKERLWEVSDAVNELLKNL